MNPITHLALAGLALALLGCGPAGTSNPPSLWLSYAQREVDLVLVDREPPAF
jgi:hypothetical protein